MKYILTIITLFTAILIADTTANIGLTLIDSDVSFSGKVKHIIDRGKWTSNFDTTYTYKTSDGQEKTNDLYFQYKEQVFPHYPLLNEVIGILIFSFALK